MVIDQSIADPSTICMSVRSLPYFSPAPPLHLFISNDATRAMQICKGDQNILVGCKSLHI